MGDIITVILNGGPHDRKEIEIHRDNLRINPKINIKDKNGNWSCYVLNDEDQYVWLSNPDDSKFSSEFYVCDDNGSVVSEEYSEEDAIETSDKLNEKEKYH